MLGSREIRLGNRLNPGRMQLSGQAKPHLDGRPQYPGRVAGLAVSVWEASQV